jgi:hypothetical protein
MAACPAHRQADRPTGSTLRNGALKHLSRLIYVVVALLVGQAVAEARPEDDALNGATLNRCLWDDWSNGGGQVTPGGALVLATSATTAPSFPQVFSQYMLTGDFSFSVSVAVAGAWSQMVAPTDQEYAYLGFYADDSNQVFIAFGRTPGGAEVVAFSFVKEQLNVLARQPVAGTSIQLQIVRSAGTASLQYNSGASWQTLATLGNFTLDGLVKLGAATIGTARPLTASFSNFSIASGTSTYRPYVAAPVVGRSDFHLGGHSAQRPDRFGQHAGEYRSGESAEFRHRVHPDRSNRPEQRHVRVRLQQYRAGGRSRRAQHPAALRVRNAGRRHRGPGGK